jgi:hypothetical protein
MADPRRRRTTTGAPRPGVALVVLLVALGSGAAARAQELSGFVELTHSRFDSTAEFPGGLRIETLSNSFLQRYALTYTQRFTPTLRLQAGGVFEWDAARFEVAGLETRTKILRQNPFFNLRLDSAPYLAEVAWSRNEEDTDTRGLPSTGQARELASATAGWFPVDLPSARLQYFKTDLFDRTRRFEDTTEDRLELTSEYRPIPELYLYYKGSTEDTDDRANETRLSRVSNSGRVIYDDMWWDDRLMVSSDYNYLSRTTETTTSGGGEVLFPRPPFAGLSAIDDTPELGTLDPNTALIDGDFVAGAGLNLGLPPAGGDLRPLNIGLDLGAVTEINSLIVWVDRDLPSGIWRSFTWDVYTSTDNLNWTRRAAPTSVAFGPFVTLFEIRFTNLVTRYVKVVTPPLSASVPFASDFPVILVTEMQAQLARPAAEAQGRVTEKSHIYSLSGRARLLDEPALFYELTYFINKSDRAPKEDQLSNGISWSQPVWSYCTVAGRVAYQTGHQRGEVRTAWLYTASLSAAPAPTLQTSLIYSGLNEDFESSSTDSRSVFLYGTAQLYPGIDANLSLGRSSIAPDRGFETDSTLINAGATLVPHPSLTVNLFYSDKSDTLRTTGISGSQDQYTRSAEGDVAYRPVPALYLFASYRAEQRSQFPDRTINDYSIDWSPFPEGTLRLNISYTESYRSDDNTKETQLIPSVRWNFNPRSWLEGSYQRLTTDSSVQRLTTDIVSATFRTAF